MESRSGERFGEYSIPGFDNFPRLVRFVGEGERERERQREREREKRGSKRGKSHGCWRRINRRADVNRTLDSVFADRANATVAGGEISLARSLSLSLSLSLIEKRKKKRKKDEKRKKKFDGSIERQSFVCVKKGFDVDIGAYITHVIDDGDSSRWLQPVVSCAD